ncbi:MAG: hypothetical protein M3Q56_03630 [Bacteroidota bacterium]|nr:hypothetical protein [Bacteroidota bacterium]
MKRNLIVILILGCLQIQSQAQVKGSMILGMDIYQWYKNPKTNELKGQGSSAGSSILCGPIGLRLAVGKENFSFSLEGAANIGLLAFDLGEFKGLGAVSFPLIGKINFDALSGFSKNKFVGYSVGLGIQYNRTEWFGLTEKFKDLERKYFPTYIVDLAMGGGIGGFNASYYFRFGFGEKKSYSFNTGLLFNISFNRQKTNLKDKTPQPQKS